MMAVGRVFGGQAWHNGLYRPLALCSSGHCDLYPNEGNNWFLCVVFELQVKCINEHLLSERRLIRKFRQEIPQGDNMSCTKTLLYKAGKLLSTLTRTLTRFALPLWN